MGLKPWEIITKHNFKYDFLALFMVFILYWKENLLLPEDKKRRFTEIYR